MKKILIIALCLMLVFLMNGIFAYMNNCVSDTTGCKKVSCKQPFSEPLVIYCTGKSVDSVTNEELCLDTETTCKYLLEPNIGGCTYSACPSAYDDKNSVHPDNDVLENEGTLIGNLLRSTFEIIFNK